MFFRSLLRSLMVLILFSFYLPFVCFAQKVKAEVSVDLRRLPLEKREKLVNFQEVISQYINSNTWCEDIYGSELLIKIQIPLQDASVSYEERYRGSLLISNNSDMQFYDKRWHFKYNFLEPLEFDENPTHPFNTVLHFYINILLGGEFDKYGKFEGSPYYKKAQTLSQQARFSRFILGWDERQIVIDDILDKKNQIYREAVDSYFLGLAYAEEDFSLTRKYCKAAIDLLKKQIEVSPQYALPGQFIDGHYIEIINIFKDAENYRGVFETLIKIDPDHEDKYKKYL